VPLSRSTPRPLRVNLRVADRRFGVRKSGLVLNHQGWPGDARDAARAGSPRPQRKRQQPWRPGGICGGDRAIEL